MTMADELGDLRGMEVCCFEDTEIALPSDLIEEPEIFAQVVSWDTWKSTISPENRKYLEKFLPVLPTDYPHANEDNLKALFSGENFKFGNPMKKVHKKLKDGCFYPDVVKYTGLRQRAKYKEYKLHQKKRYHKLLKEIITSRQAILGQIERQGPSEPIRTRKPAMPKSQLAMEQRVNARFKKIIQECKEESQDTNVSSEDERAVAHCGPLAYPISPFHMSPGLWAMTGGFQPHLVQPIPGMPFGYHPAFPFPTPSRPTTSPSPSNHVVTDSDIQAMLQKHRKRRIDSDDHPELDTRFTSVQDIVLRTNPRPCKRIVKTVDKEKKKDKKLKVKRKLKQKLQQKQERQCLLGPETSHQQQQQPVHQQQQEQSSASASQYAPTGKFVCFFTLLREVFYALPDLKGSLHKVEDRVKAWQGTASYSANQWSTQQHDWTKLVYSALIYMSGSSGATQEGFVPLVDFKERPQQWKWIGSFRDSDEDLALLCQEWLQVKEKLMLKKGSSDSGGGSSNLPAARVKTDFVVRPSTDEEREEFRRQELMRYDNPHKAFTFVMHGFESIVGPVKGVFNKDSTLNKAREHSLLISNRPPYVTILTLVRDAAARLPNGEGTRAEVCELLKDSQFLNTDATDSQIHTVVSGALDRLHYEKDPCVKYDSNRKVWIYLHRHRTEEEFEKIHQANAAAARAKRATKPKAPRQQKSKEPVPVSTQPSVLTSIDPDAAIRGLTSLSTELPPVSTKQRHGKKGSDHAQMSSDAHPKVSVIISTSRGDPNLPGTHSVLPEDEPNTGFTSFGEMGRSPPSRVLKLPANFTPSPGSHASRLPPHVSPLNTHTSVLNAADHTSDSTARQNTGKKPMRIDTHPGKPELVKENEQSPDESSGSDNNSEPESGVTSSSEDENTWRLPPSTGGKTRPEAQIDQQTGQGGAQCEPQGGPPCKLKLSVIQGNIRMVSGNPDVQQPGRQESQGEVRRWNLSEGTMPGRSDIGEGYIIRGETEDSSSSSGSDSDYSDDDEE